MTGRPFRLGPRAAATALAVALAAGAPAAAQQGQPLPPLPGERDPLADAASEGVPAGFFFEPSLLFGQFFDDNVFLSTESPESDSFIRLTPAIESGYRSQRSLVIARYSLEGERYRQHPELEALNARQQATFDVSAFSSPRLLVSAGAGYFETTTPSELNRVTGIVTGRARAERLGGRAQVHYRTSPNGRLRGEYLIDRDQLEDDLDSLTQRATVEYRHQLTTRAFVSADYVLHHFHFRNQSQRPQHVVAAGVGYRVTPSTVFVVRGGPRLIEEVIGPGVPLPLSPNEPEDPEAPPPSGVGPVPGERRIERSLVPEWRAELSSVLPRGTFDLSVARTQGTAFGVGEIIDTTGVSASLLYHPASRVDLRVSPGFFHDEFGPTETRTFRMGAGLTVWITPHVAVDGQYVYSHQEGLPLELTDGPIRLRQSVISFGLRLSARRRPNPPEPVTMQPPERR